MDVKYLIVELWLDKLMEESLDLSINVYKYPIVLWLFFSKKIWILSSNSHLFL